jgi:hypothetical protein
VLEYLGPAPSLISVGMLSRTFSAGASISAHSLKYARLAETIMEEELGPERLARVFRLSACKTAKVDCAFVLLCGSISKYRAAPAVWNTEPESSLCRNLIGDDFDRTSDAATRFVKANWLAIQELANGVEVV